MSHTSQPAFLPLFGEHRCAAAALALAREPVLWGIITGAHDGGATGSRLQPELGSGFGTAGRQFLLLTRQPPCSHGPASARPLCRVTPRPRTGFSCVLICVRADLPRSEVRPPWFRAGAIRQSEPQWKDSASRTGTSQALLGAPASLTVTCHSPPPHCKGFGEPPGPSKETTRPGENLGLRFLYAWLHWLWGATRSDP